MDKKLFSNLITSFLNRNFPVTRVKYNYKFKRAIIINSKIYLVNGQDSLSIIAPKLIKIVKDVFNYDESTSIEIINNFLPSFLNKK